MLLSLIELTTERLVYT